MSSIIIKLTNSNLIKPINAIVRYGHHLRGKAPGVARTLQQRMDELNYKDPEIHFKVDIGLPHKKLDSKEESTKRLEILKANRNNLTLEEQARNKSLLIDLNDAKEDWAQTVGPHHIKTLAEHYGVFEHLFGDAYFYPMIALNVDYNQGDCKHPVYYGNVIKPSLADNAPEISYESDEKTLWTLIMTNPDGHLTQQDKEYVHWFVGNIPGNKLEQGETIINYLQPFPPKGTGYHRHIFVLYKQEEKIDFGAFKKSNPCWTLDERTFSTFDFYRNLQDKITPAGLAFFQSDWDASLTAFFHHKLGMQQPFFEYDFPETYIKKQTWFPLREAFNLYMDRYRDPKQINKEFLQRKLKGVHPFKPPTPSVPYPNAVRFEPGTPSWLKLEKTKSRNKWGRINDIE